MDPQIESQLEAQLLTAAKIIEKEVDNELTTLDNLDDDAIEKIRQQRLQEMKKQAVQRQEWISLGHGKYTEIADEKQFFEDSKRSSNVVCHFYRPSALRCEIVDKHLTILAQKHIKCKFVKLNAERAPFLTRRLKIRVIPTIALIKDSLTKDYIVGFDDLGGHDNFTTKMMEWRIAQAGVIDYKGDLLTPPDQRPNKGILGVQKKKNVRADGDDSSDNDDW